VPLGTKRTLAAFAAPVVEGAQGHGFHSREIIHLKMVWKEFTTATCSMIYAQTLAHAQTRLYL